MYKTLNFLLWNEQKGELESAEGNGRPSKQDAWSVEKISITWVKKLRKECQ
jgi:hypothetical protein